MPRPSHTSHKQIAEAFVRELEAFKHGGYRFPNSGRELFEGTQREAFDAYLDGLKANHREGYYEIPTGVGKTALFIAIIGCYLRATENIPDAPRVLIHEPTTDLVIQTAQSFADFLPDIAKRMEADDDCGREIDWANSQIDVHYTRRHGAENKPRVLITTYQGQATDQRKSKERRIHDPAEFGLVIHDEAHYLTGQKFGPAAVDKFKGAIQLGVTATPEYSADKTVANKLGHRYYHLPLYTAIERGDLCHVRPIVLKTHLRGKDAINLAKAKEFLEQQQGHPLTNRQLEQLLNQEARNQAIIKAYLTGSHPDTAERFLGQTGLIFAGGITHCNDFILHTERVLNQPAYRPIKQWLRDEGVALIAPVHSDNPPDGVEVNFGGKRKKCTKDEIKELHRQGKILLIISDQELKLGSDFPMDSFIVDAVDRFSVPDATQRMGRGFRVDRGDARRNLPPKPDKSCVAINVIDETTHDMYRGTSFHPIHASEILQGAEHRPPGPRVGAVTRFKQHPPEVSERLEALGFEFLTSAEAIRDVAKRFADSSTKGLPAKTDEWWSYSEVLGAPGGAATSTQQALATLLEAFKAGSGVKESDGIVVLTHHGAHIHMRHMRGSTKPVICFFKQDIIDAGLVHSQALAAKTDEWWSMFDLRQKPLGETKKAREFIRQVTLVFNAGGGIPQPDGSVLIEHDGIGVHVQQMQAGSQSPICFRGQDVINAGLVRGQELPVRTDKWWTSRDIAKRPGGESQRTKRALAEMIQRFESSGNDGLAKMSFGSKTIRMQRMRSGTVPCVCFFGQDIADAGLIQEHALPPKTLAWLSLKDIRNAPRGGSGQTRAALENILGSFEAGEGQQERDGSMAIQFQGKLVHVQKMQASGMQPVCFLGDDLVRAGLIDAPDREHLKQTKRGKKDISPSSGDLKRTGRLRSGPEE